MISPSNSADSIYDGTYNYEDSLPGDCLQDRYPRRISAERFLRSSTVVSSGPAAAHARDGGDPLPAVYADRERRLASIPVPSQQSLLRFKEFQFPFPPSSSQPAAVAGLVAAAGMPHTPPASPQPPPAQHVAEPVPAGRLRSPYKLTEKELQQNMTLFDDFDYAFDHTSSMHSNSSNLSTSGSSPASGNVTSVAASNNGSGLLGVPALLPTTPPRRGNRTEVIPKQYGERSEPLEREPRNPVHMYPHFGGFRPDEQWEFPPEPRPLEQRFAPMALTDVVVPPHKPSPPKPDRPGVVRYPSLSSFYSTAADYLGYGRDMLASLNSSTAKGNTDTDHRSQSSSQAGSDCSIYDIPSIRRINTLSLIEAEHERIKAGYITPQQDSGVQTPRTAQSGDIQTEDRCITMAAVYPNPDGTPTDSITTVPTGGNCMFTMTDDEPVDPKHGNHTPSAGKSIIRKNWKALSCIVGLVLCLMVVISVLIARNAQLSRERAGGSPTITTSSTSTTFFEIPMPTYLTSTSEIPMPTYLFSATPASTAGVSRETSSASPSSFSTWMNATSTEEGVSATPTYQRTTFVTIFTKI